MHVCQEKKISIMTQAWQHTYRTIAHKNTDSKIYQQDTISEDCNTNLPRLTLVKAAGLTLKLVKKVS